MDATTAPARGPSALAEAHVPLRRPAVSGVVAFRPGRILPQPAASEVVALPVLEAEVAEFQVVDPAPQASRYSDSLFRQPRLISFLS